MKRLLLLILSTVALTAQAQTDHWYGYPPDRQVAAGVGFTTGALFYTTARTAQPDQPKWKAMVISTGATTLMAATIAAMPNQSTTERRQNFTTTFLSGLSVTLIFSLGI